MSHAKECYAPVANVAERNTSHYSPIEERKKQQKLQISSFSLGDSDGRWDAKPAWLKFQKRANKWAKNALASVTSCKITHPRNKARLNLTRNAQFPPETLTSGGTRNFSLMTFLRKRLAGEISENLHGCEVGRPSDGTLRILCRGSVTYFRLLCHCVLKSLTFFQIYLLLMMP